MLDHLIKGATIVDGSGEPGFVGDVAVRDGRIVAVGKVTETARHTIDADGLIVPSAALLDDPSDSLRCIAAHHVAERRLVALRPHLARLSPASPLVTQAFDQAIARLDA